ncbi:MAG: Wzz/FepE/Etk N-terminal domain-containing protein, partial [Methanothrix sp.]
MDERIDDEIDLRDIFLVLWKSRRLIAAIFLIAVVAAGAISIIMPSVYRASCIVVLGNFEDPIYTTQAGAVEIIKSDAFLANLSDNLNLSLSPGQLDALRESISVEPVKGSDRLLRISIETEDPAEGKRILEGMVLLFFNMSSKSYSEQRG